MFNMTKLVGVTKTEFPRISREREGGPFYHIREVVLSLWRAVLSYVGLRKKLPELPEVTYIERLDSLDMLDPAVYEEWLSVNDTRTFYEYCYFTRPEVSRVLFNGKYVEAELTSSSFVPNKLEEARYIPPSRTYYWDTIQ